eukprot:Gb_15416 [translate_table: standard]
MVNSIFEIIRIIGVASSPPSYAIMIVDSKVKASLGTFLECAKESLWFGHGPLQSLDCMGLKWKDCIELHTHGRHSSYPTTLSNQASGGDDGKLNFHTVEDLLVSCMMKDTTCRQTEEDTGHYGSIIMHCN